MEQPRGRSVRRAGMAGITALTLGLTACSGGGDSSSGPGGGDEGKALSVATATPFVSWDPIEPFTPYGGGLYYQAVYDTLIHENAEGELTPDLATQWNYDDALTTLTMDLRTDVKFTDGSAFDADAAVTNLERTRKTDGPRKADLANVTSVKAVDEDTIELKLSEPDPGLVEQLARTSGQMVSPNSLKAGSFDTPVGTGPYILDEENTVDGESYAFKRNEDYWNKDAWGFDTVDVKWVNDPSARLNALKAGQINASVIEFTQLEEASSGGLSTHEVGGGVVGIQFLDIDGETPISDVKVRQAINYAIDSQALSDAFSAGTGRVTDQAFGPDDAGYVEELDNYYERDLDKAKELLKEAGYEDGVTITVPDSTGAFPGIPIMDTLKKQLSEAGITLNVVDSALDFPEIVNRMIAGTYPSWVTQWSLGTDWNVISQWLLPSSTFNPYKVSDPEVEKLIENIRNTTGDDQTTAYQDLNRYLVENAWTAYAYATPYAYATDDTVEMAEHVGEQSAWLADLSPAS